MLAARGVVEDGAHVGVVLPLHTGRTLAERVATEGPLPPDQVARLARHLAEALGAAHRAGVLHRDVSARNVLLDERGGPVLTDFGLARVGETATAGATALLGTAGYIAPELLRGERPDPRADLYGLGAVLYLAATGREPFAASHAQAAIRRQLDGEVAAIGSVVAGFPTWLDVLIRALLDPDPAKRPSGAADLVAALEERRAPTAEAPKAPVSAGVPVRAALPSGDWTVVVEERQDRRDTRRVRRALKKRAKEARQAERKGRGLAADAVRLVDQAALALDALTGAAAGPPIEAELAAIVARAAGIPPEALGEAGALEHTRLRLVAHVERATAERLANEVRA
ncbi:MAG: serine/threonine-protein kinase, partial [Myxococcota bacterium]